MSQAAAVKPARPEFHDLGLKKALERAAPKIESFTARLDQLSSDIKSLESYLERSAIRVPARVKLAKSRGMSGEYIAWELGEPDRFRVVYFRMDETDDQVDQTVLIEAPIAVRVRAKPALPELLRAVGDAASLGQPDEATSNNEVDESQDGAPPSRPPSDEDIPF